MSFNRYINTLLPVIIVYSIITFPYHTISPLNSINGLNPLYLLTVLTFKVSIIGPFILVTARSKFKKPIVVVAGLLFVLYLLNCTIPLFYKFINYSKINTGLFNPLGQYHPALLFSTLIAGAIIFLESRNFGPIRLKVIVSWKLLITLGFSAWWANQELFWGNYWNWDPVELSSLLVLVTFLAGFHYKQIKGTLRIGIDKLKVWSVLVITVSYITNRGPTANSVHQFSGTFYLKIDNIWFWCVWFFFTTILLITTTTAPKTLLQLSKKPIPNKTLITAALFTLPTLLIVYIYLSTVGLLQAKPTSTYLIILLIITALLLRKKINNHIPYKSAHALPMWLLFITIVYSEPPQTTLFSEQIYHSTPYLRPSNNYSLLSKSFGHCNHYLKSGYYGNSIKHQSTILRNMTNTTTKQFTKFNTNTTYITIDSNNASKLFFFRLK